MSSTPLHADWLDLLRLLEKHRVRYLLIGGHAVSTHAEPRYTEDLDILVAPTRANGVRLRAALTAFGLGSVAPSPDEIAKPGPFWTFGRKPIRLDVLTEIPAVSFAAAWKRRLDVVLGGCNVHVIGREDLLANKRASGRPKDLADADAIARFAAVARETERTRSVKREPRARARGKRGR